MHKLLFIIFLSFSLTNSFNTSWGKCYLHLTDSYVNSQELIKIINSTISNMNNKYGNVKKKILTFILLTQKKIIILFQMVLHRHGVLG